MDPYELFSTPPGDAMLSSTPAKQKNGPNGRKKQRDDSRLTLKGDKCNRSSFLNLSKSVDESHQSFTKKGLSKKKRNQKNQNLWDKCIKSNPELAQFVDHFNQSLEEATKKPLDMTSDP